MAREFDWAYPEPIGGGGWTGDYFGERQQRRDRGVATTSAQVPANTSAMRIHTWPWKLEWGLVEVLGGLSGGESERRGELTSATSMAVRAQEEEAALL
jgi:hypothetical protein